MIKFVKFFFMINVLLNKVYLWCVLNSYSYYGLEFQDLPYLSDEDPIWVEIIGKI